ncbi:hypothetical protein TSUD_165890 [Trifolium subterraneum]|uniref:Uncharacterized protein n=1 Tax=Trifolium subterraneum TaxID=3900 RepID=A0A2Z6ML87_TRISU|nr:hypothetical protein TSUD_165890 [Trifolium subterraneum]
MSLLRKHVEVANSEPEEEEEVHNHTREVVVAVEVVSAPKMVLRTEEAVEIGTVPVVADNKVVEKNVDSKDYDSLDMEDMALVVDMNYIPCHHRDYIHIHIHHNN